MYLVKILGAEDGVVFDKLAMNFLLDKLKREKRYATTFWKRLYRRAPIITCLIWILPAPAWTYFGWWSHSKYGVIFAKQEQHLPSNTIGDVIGNKGIVTQGQQGDNYLQTQKPDRILDDMTKKALLIGVPKDKKVSIRILSGGDGATERENLADQIDEFLTKEGYEITKPHLSFLPLSGHRTPVGIVVQPMLDIDQPTQILIGTNTR